MTLQWTFVATVLYIEIFLVSILLLPFISPPTWQKIFRSRLSSLLSAYSKIYFYIFIAILLLLFAESIREVRKYSEPITYLEGKVSQASETMQHLKLFRAQRNLYISGFALFLWFILRRLVILIATEATLMAQSEASIKQAQSASAVAQELMDQKSNIDENKKNKTTEEKREDSDTKESQSIVQKELTQTQKELEQTKEELYRAKMEFETMKKQAESTNNEYDRLLQEHEKLQHKLSSVDGSPTEEKKGV